MLTRRLPGTSLARRLPGTSLLALPREITDSGRELDCCDAPAEEVSAFQLLIRLWDCEQPKKGLIWSYTCQDYNRHSRCIVSRTIVSMAMYSIAQSNHRCTPMPAIRICAQKGSRQLLAWLGASNDMARKTKQAPTYMPLRRRRLSGNGDWMYQEAVSGRHDRMRTEPSWRVVYLKVCTTLGWSSCSPRLASISCFIASVSRSVLLCSITCKWRMRYYLPRMCNSVHGGPLNSRWLEQHTALVHCRSTIAGRVAWHRSLAVCQMSTS